MKLFSAVLLFASISAFAEPGFFSKQDAGVPSAVRSASGSVFRMISLHPWSVEGEELVNAVQNACAPGQDQVFAMMCQELKKCQAENARSCTIPYTGMGTAFVAEQGNRLWTVRHNIDSFLELAKQSLPAGLSREAQYKTLLQTKLDFVLLDENNKLVYDTRVSGATLKAFGHVSQFKGTEQIGADQPFDFAVIELGKRIASPLKLTGSAAHGEPVFIMGYPTVSQLRAREFARADSNGRQLYVSKGVVVPAYVYVQPYYPNTPLGPGNLPVWFETIYLHYDADGIPGQSGAPVLSAQGEVVSIFASHNAHDFQQGGTPADRYDASGGRGVRPSWIMNLLNGPAKLQ